MERKIGIKRIGEHLFVAVEKDWIQIDPETEGFILQHQAAFEEGKSYSTVLDFERMVVVKQYREVGIQNQKTYERWVTLKPGQRKPFYIKRRELAVFTLPQTQDA